MNCPETFSFIEEPELALIAIQRFVGAVVSGALVVSVDQSMCKRIDLCAASVLNALALEAGSRYRVQYSGQYPANAEATEIVLATGLPKALSLPLPEPEGFLTFPLVRGAGKPATATQSTMKELEASKLADYVSDCLDKYGFKLTRDGLRLLGSLVGEVLTNAEEHSGTTDWWIAAYLRQPKDAQYGDCHITIFNFGDTLADSLQKLPTNSRLRKEMDDLVRMHTKRSFFRRRRWTQDDLWTLYALQEGVSRLNVEEGALGNRGLGTIAMIEMFQALGQVLQGADRPMMCVLSGNTHILFDGTFRLAPKPSGDGEERRIIAFNDTNDLGRPPDGGYVRHLKRRFPGTLISLRFYIDPEYLEKATGQHATYHRP